MTRTKKIGTLLVTCTLVLLLCGCGDEEDGQQSPPPEQPAARSASPAVSAAAGGEESATPASPGSPTTVEPNRQTPAPGNEGERAEAIAAETLKDLLPTSLAGMERADASAERSPLTGVDITAADARYEAADGGSISVTITDIGNVPGPMRTGLAAWAVVEYDRQTDAGYEKSGTYSGLPGMEEYSTKTRRGAIRVLVADRFIVAVEGDGLAMDAIQQALGRIDVKRLAALASTP